MKSPIEEDIIYKRRREICARLKQKRLDAGIAIEELAPKTGISIHNIERIEAGKWNCGLDVLIIYSEALGFDIDFS